MSVEKDGQLTRFNCDGGRCHKNYEGTDGFSNVWAEAKHHGWVNSEHRDGWRHYCSQCKLEYGDD